MYRRVPRRNSTVPKHPLFIALFLLSGCAAYQPRPLAPAQMAEAYEARTLDSRDLRDFVARGLRREITQWPLKSWDFSTLTLAAFYFGPDLDVARAKWATSKAAIKTAGAIPNPVLQIPFEYATNAPRGESPYTLGLGLDIPIETAGKRGYRLTQADLVSDAARFNIGNVAWQVRSRLRGQLLGLYSARLEASLREQQLAAQQEIVDILAKRLSLGAASATEANAARIQLARNTLDLSNARKRIDDAKALIASAIGLPVRALANVDLDVHAFTEIELKMPAREVHRKAILNRADVLSALSEYEASQAALQLEVARQYPDIHLGPGYLFDTGLNKIELPVAGIALPIFNRNEGPIAQAEAQRTELAAQVNALQAKALDEVDRAMQGYASARKNLALADSLLRAQREELQSLQRTFETGETDRLTLTLARHSLYTDDLARGDALTAVQQAIGQLEDAMQWPLSTDASSNPAEKSGLWEENHAIAR
jgi:outer membrane protein, heavy metal efflux system